MRATCYLCGLKRILGLMLMHTYGLALWLVTISSRYWLLHITDKKVTKWNQKLLFDCTEDWVCLTTGFSQLQPLCLGLQTIFLHILYFNLPPVISSIKIMYPARLINQTLFHMLHYSLSFLLIFPVTFLYHIFCLELYYINLTDKFPIHFCPKSSKIFHISLLPASNYGITHIPTYLHLELAVTCMF
jgi:hypothetical protein